MAAIGQITEEMRRGVVLETAGSCQRAGARVRLAEQGEVVDGPSRRRRS